MAQLRHLQFKTPVWFLSLLYHPKLSAGDRVLPLTLQHFPKAGFMQKIFTWSLSNVIHKLLCSFSKHSNIHSHWCWLMQCSRSGMPFEESPTEHLWRGFTCSPSDTPRDGAIAAAHRTELTKALYTQDCSTVFTRDASREASQINSRKWHWHITHTPTHVRVQCLVCWNKTEGLLEP